MIRLSRKPAPTRCCGISGRFNLSVAALRSELRRAGIPAFSPQEKENRSPVSCPVVSRSLRDGHRAIEDGRQAFPLLGVGVRASAPNSKFQIPNPKEMPSPKIQCQRATGELELGIWSFFGIWGLELGILFIPWRCAGSLWKCSGTLNPSHWCMEREPPAPPAPFTSPGSPGSPLFARGSF
jgi:hypothetical protein